MGLPLMNQGFSIKSNYKEGALKRFILCYVFGLAIALFIFTNASHGKDSEGGRGFFCIGGSQLNLDDLNAALTNNGYSKWEKKKTKAGAWRLASESVTRFLL